MLSPAVLDKALENSAVANLPMVSKQKDKRSWLARKLRIRPEGLSEILTVSIITNDANASEIIVNSVVDAYIENSEAIDRQRSTDLLSSLQIERRQLLTQAARLQESLHTKTAQSGNPVPIDQDHVWRALTEAEINLVAMQAKRKAIAERIEHPPIIPEEVLLQLNPELSTLEEQIKNMQQARERLKQTISDQENDPRIMQIDRQIEQMEERFKTIALDTEGDGTRTMPNVWRTREIASLFHLDLEIRVQEVLVAELTRVYNGGGQNNRGTEAMAEDKALDQYQLDRVNAILVQIEDRIMAIQLEQRAPDRITLLTRAVTSTPRMKPKMVLGIGIVMLIFFPVLLGLAFRR